MRPRQNGRRFLDDIFRRIFFNEKCYILMKMSFKFVPQSPSNNTPALIQIMALCQPDDKLLLEAMMALCNDTYMCHLSSIS